MSLEKSSPLPVFFAITLFVSSVLLFLIQPMFAKMVLPLLGGSPAVWNTCMVFFQAALLAGYAYAHETTTRLDVRRQAAVHLGVLLLPLLTLPLLALPLRLAHHENLGATTQPLLLMFQRSGLLAWLEHPPRASNPLPWLLLLLLVAVGLPFFVLSTSAPLLQRWFASTAHPSAHDPYFLYGASNLGSMLALLSYPLLLEPNLPLAQQVRVWIGGYVLLLMLAGACGVLLLRDARQPGVSDKEPKSKREPQTSLPRWRWVALAFVPSSLMLSVTTYLTTDIAAIPLLWVIPLALYLLSFILVFARRSFVPQSKLSRGLPLLLLLVSIVMLSEATEPVWLVILLHLLTFFVVALVCHGELAHTRPPAEHLTAFFLWLSVGGVLGGMFNALIAPVLFSGIVEYPLVLVLASLLRRPDPRVNEDRTHGKRKTGNSARAPYSALSTAHRLDVLLPAALFLLNVGLILGGQRFGLQPGGASVGLMFGLPAVLCYTFLHRPIRFGLGLGSVFLASVLYHGVHGEVLHRERSFFGVHRVTRDPRGRFRELVHGSTVHGRQSIDPALEREPLTYFHPTGPIGQVFAALSAASARPHVAVVGLGTGSLAAYAAPGQPFTYYEIDPAVNRLAHDNRYFTFLRDSPAQIEVILGDARLTLAEAPPRQYGLLVVDAFSSDAIPLHLLTREALELYLNKLTEDGLLAFNISNRYVQLEPVLGDLAQSQGLVCLGQADLNLTEAEKQAGKSPSQWVILARTRGHLGKLVSDPRWHEVQGRSNVPAWTDDFSNLFSVFQWN